VTRGVEEASMEETVKTRASSIFKRPLTFKALKERGLCPT
jgi:hypothetical protein